ncbi:MAG: metal-dependent hydrolase [Candidatus Aminicenantales bacterium]
MEITWLGHSGVKIKGTKTIFLDPFLTGNPAASTAPDEIEEADVVIVTHYHSDHLGDAFAICKKTGATLVGIHEIAVEAEQEGITAEGMNVGGTVEVKGIKIHMVTALHSAEKGDPAGVVVQLDGKTIYHAGDTGLTYDMKLIGEFFKPDLSFLPIGDRYTMGIPSAVKAVELINSKVVIPVHFGTFPIINTDPQEFKHRVGDKAEVVILKPGESYNL